MLIVRFVVGGAVGVLLGWIGNRVAGIIRDNCDLKSRSLFPPRKGFRHFLG